MNTAVVIRKSFLGRMFGSAYEMVKETRETLRLYKDKEFGIPAGLEVALQEEGMSLESSERARLASLHMRSSPMWTGINERAELSVKVAFWSAAPTMFISFIMGILDIHGLVWALPIFMLGFVIVPAWYWKFVTSIAQKKWDISMSEDWDAVLKDVMPELLKKGYAPYPELMQIYETLKAGEWLDMKVYRALGPVDTLGMLRLSHVLREASTKRVAVNLVLDGDTHELVSRVADVVTGFTKEEIRVSAMRGIRPTMVPTA